LLWAVDPVPEETVEDPIVVLGKFVKKAGVKMWQTVRKRSAMASQQERDCHGCDIIDIKPDEPSVIPPSEISAEEAEKHGSAVRNDEGERLQRATWSAERGAPQARTHQARRSTGDLPTFSRFSKTCS